MLARLLEIKRLVMNGKQITEQMATKAQVTDTGMEEIDVLIDKRGKLVKEERQQVGVPKELVLEKLYRLTLRVAKFLFTGESLN